MAAARSSRRRNSRADRGPRNSNAALACAAYHGLEIIIRLDDLDQAILGGAVAAVGVGVVLFDQRLVSGLDVLERRADAEPHHLQRLAFGVEDLARFDLGLGARAGARPPTAAAVEFAE